MCWCLLFTQLRDATSEAPTPAVLRGAGLPPVLVQTVTEPQFQIWVSPHDAIISTTIADKGVWEPELSALASYILSTNCAGGDGACG